MPDGWDGRPRLDAVETALFNDFVKLAEFCGGDPRPADALAWFEIHEVSPSERGWMARLYASMAAVLRERGGASDGEA